MSFDSILSLGQSALELGLITSLTVLALWPWLWSDPVGRLREYIEFHQFHAYYNTEFLGINYNRPPLPISYPFVLTWATVPTGAWFRRTKIRPSPASRTLTADDRS